MLLVVLAIPQTKFACLHPSGVSEKTLQQQCMCKNQGATFGFQSRNHCRSTGKCTSSNDHQRLAPKALQFLVLQVETWSHVSDLVYHCNKTPGLQGLLSLHSKYYFLAQQCKSGVQNVISIIGFISMTTVRDTIFYFPHQLQLWETTNECIIKSVVL